MVDIPNKLIKDIQKGLKTQKDLETYLMSNHSINEILTAFAELILISDDTANRPQITVTQDEYNQIMSLFKIKGLRSLDGMVVAETRGRKKINPIK